MHQSGFFLTIILIMAFEILGQQMSTMTPGSVRYTSTVSQRLWRKTRPSSKLAHINYTWQNSDTNHYIQCCNNSHINPENMIQIQNLDTNDSI